MYIIAHGKTVIDDHAFCPLAR